MKVLDLFAGTGSIGIEALSRGAARAYFVDNNNEAVKYIHFPRSMDEMNRARKRLAFDDFFKFMEE